MNIVLYYAPITCALVPYITLTEAKAEFEVRLINMRKEQHKSPEYLAINPQHKVPLLIVDGRKLSENPAMQLWISRAFPAANLMPRDPWDEVQAISIMSWCASGIHPYLARTNNPAKVATAPGSADGVVAIARENLIENLAIADTMLKGRDYFFDHFTAPDAHFFWCQRRAKQFELNLPAFPNCEAHFQRMLGRASVQKLLAFEKETQAKFAAAP